MTLTDGVTRNQLVEHLEQFQQTHLIRHWDSLSPDERQSLASQIASIDFVQLKRLHGRHVQGDDWRAIAACAVSPPALRLQCPDNPWSPEAARERGEQILRAGEVAAVLVAGGQGTRLGFPHPKGMFSIGPVSRRTLFQIHVDRLQAIGARYGARIPLLLMTSPATDTETREYFASRSNFGLSSSELYFFQQGTMPSVEQRTGRVILSAPGEVSLSPDGHGGMLAALDRVGLITMARQRGIKYLFYFQVDNPLVAVADPEFLGYHALARSELTSQVVAKKDPLEKVGSVVSVDGQLRVIEYSDLPDDLAALTDAEGRPVFWAGSIAVHVFDVDFLQRAAGVEDWLPFHTAHKKVPSIDEEGNTVTPGEPNAVKFERFIFDLLPHAERAIVVEVDERQAFAPVKNASGAPKDTPETARQAMLAQHGRWLAECGARVGTGVKVEISPKFALDAEELRGKLPPETLLEEDTFLS